MEVDRPVSGSEELRVVTSTSEAVERLRWGAALEDDHDRLKRRQARTDSVQAELVLDPRVEQRARGHLVLWESRHVLDHEPVSDRRRMHRHAEALLDVGQPIAVHHRCGEFGEPRGVREGRLSERDDPPRQLGLSVVEDQVRRLAVRRREAGCVGPDSGMRGASRRQSRANRQPDDDRHDTGAASPTETPTTRCQRPHPGQPLTR